MRFSISARILALFVAVIFLAGCSSTKMAKDFNGMGSPDGTPIAHLSTSNMAVHLLMGKPLWGDASLEKTVSDFTQAAKQEKASKVRIVQSTNTSYWYLFFPITLVLTPVITNVAGEAIK